LLLCMQLSAQQEEHENHNLPFTGYKLCGGK
jgi:hypothetical protein